MNTATLALLVFEVLALTLSTEAAENNGKVPKWSGKCFNHSALKETLKEAQKPGTEIQCQEGDVCYKAHYNKSIVRRCAPDLIWGVGCHSAKVKNTGKVTVCFCKDVDKCNAGNALVTPSSVSLGSLLLLLYVGFF